MTSTTCCASPARIRWAMLRANLEWYDIGGPGPVTMDDARTLAVKAGVPLAALYLPDPSRLEMLRAWARGRLR